MSLRRSVALAVAMATLSLVSAAWASPWALKPGEFYSELSGSAFTTNSFYRNGDHARVGLGGALEQRVLRSHNEMGWKQHTSVWFDVPFVSRTFAPDAGGAITSTGLGDLDFGFRRGMHLGKAPLALELGWITPLGSNGTLFPGTGSSGGMDGASYGALAIGSLRDSNAFFRQGLQSLSAAIELGGTAGKGSYWTIGGGYRTDFLTIGARKIEDRYADFGTGRVSLGMWLGQRLLVSGDFRGEWPLSQGNAYDRVSTPIVGGNSTDREAIWMIAGPRFTLRVDERMDVFAGSWHTPSGRNVLHADEYYCGIAWKQTGLDRLAGALGGTKAR
jgi:hypothetical protein